MSKANEAGDRAAWVVLHGELAERLAGISLLLSAATRRLDRERHPVAEDLKIAAAHLGTSLAEIRHFAARTDPAAKSH